jgi:hypothetical protein
MPGRKCSICEGPLRARSGRPSKKDTDRDNKWPAPICVECDEWLTNVVTPALREMEEADPKVKETWERIQETAREFYEES